MSAIIDARTRLTHIERELGVIERERDALLARADSRMIDQLDELEADIASLQRQRDLDLAAIKRIEREQREAERAAQIAQAEADEADAIARYPAILQRASDAAAVLEDCDRELAVIRNRIRAARKVRGDTQPFTPIKLPHIDPQWRPLAARVIERHVSPSRGQADVEG